MKKILLMGFLFVSFAACKKDKDPDPDLATRASGTFIASKFTYGGVNIPLVSGTEIVIVFQRTDAESVTGTMKVRLEGQSEPDEPLGTLAVKDAGPSGVDLYEAGRRIGNVSKDKQLTLSGDAEGVFFEIIAKKQ